MVNHQYVQLTGTAVLCGFSAKPAYTRNFVCMTSFLRKVLASVFNKISCLKFLILVRLNFLWAFVSFWNLWVTESFVIQLTKLAPCWNCPMLVHFNFFCLLETVYVRDFNSKSFLTCQFTERIFYKSCASGQMCSVFTGVWRKLINLLKKISVSAYIRGRHVPRNPFSAEKSANGTQKLSK